MLVFRPGHAGTCVRCRRKPDNDHRLLTCIPPRLWRNWSTRGSQAPVGASPWGFESLQPHQGNASDVHSRAAVAEVLALRSEGLGARRIARRTKLPLSTVRDWLVGRLPAHSRVERAIASVCETCGCDAHSFDRLLPAYVYLLGLYLGDGCISEQRRRVYRLRVVLDLRYPGIIGWAAGAMRHIRGGSVGIQKHRNQNCVDV